MDLSLRTVILLVLLGIVVLVIVGSHYKLFAFNHKSETFVDKAHDAYEDTIRSVIRTYLLREPLVHEIKKYKLMMKSPNDLNKVMPEVKRTEEYQDILKSTERSREDPNYSPNIPLQLNDYDIIDTRVNKLKPDKKTAIYREVIELYDITLNRMPTMKELNYYTARMVSDEDMTRDQLKKILESSREYHILKRNQSNQVFGELPMNATTQQIAYEVEEIYRETMGLESSEVQQEEDYVTPLNYLNEGMMTEEMMQFFKHKYVEYELNKDKLRDLIKLIHKLDENNLNVQKILDYDFKKGGVSRRILDHGLDKKKDKTKEDVRQTDDGMTQKQQKAKTPEKKLEMIRKRRQKEIKTLFDNDKDKDRDREQEQEQEQEIISEEGGDMSDDNNQRLLGLREAFAKIRRKYSPNPVERVKDKIMRNSKKRMKKMGSAFSTFSYPIKDEKDKNKEDKENKIEGFMDSDASEESDAEKDIRQKRKDVVKQRFKDMKERRGYESSDVYSEKEEEAQESREKRFNEIMDAKNKRVRKIYESENEDAIPTKSKTKSNNVKSDDEELEKNENGESSSRFDHSLFRKMTPEQRSEYRKKRMDELREEKQNEKRKREEGRKRYLPHAFRKKQPLTERAKRAGQHERSIPQGPIPLTEYNKDPDCIFGKNLDAPKVTDIHPYVTENYIFLNKGYQIYDKEDKEVTRKVKDQKKLDTGIDPYRKINDVTKQIYDNRRNGLAYMQNERNMNELSHICNRQSSYLNNPTPYPF